MLRAPAPTAIRTRTMFSSPSPPKPSCVCRLFDCAWGEFLTVRESVKGHSSTAPGLPDVGGIGPRRKRRKGASLVRAGSVPFPTEVEFTSARN